MGRGPAATVASVTRPSMIIVLAALALLEGLFLLGYAAYDVIEAFRTGITGPDEVSNPAALLGLIAITALFGAGLVWVATGWWQGRTWARSPFIFAQLIIGFIGFELSQSTDAGPKTIGQVAMVLAVVAIVLSFLPSVRRVLAEDDSPADGTSDGQA